MMDVFKKGVRLGIGLTVLTKEKLDNVAKQVAKEGKISNKKVKHTVSQLMKDIKKQQQKLNGLIDKETKKKIRELGYVSKAEAVKFLNKMRSLETTLEEKARKKGGRLNKRLKGARKNTKKRALAAAKKGLNMGLRSAAKRLR